MQRQKVVDTSGFKIDEFEQNAEEFEKYVDNIDKVLPKRGKDLKGEVVNYVQKYHNGEVNLQHMFGILKAVRDWGADSQQREQNEQLYQVQSKLASLATRKTEFQRQINKMESKLISLVNDYQDLLDESEGIQTEEELDERIGELMQQIKDNMRSGDDDLNGAYEVEVRKLKAVRDDVRQTECVLNEIAELEKEKSDFSKQLKEVNEDYKSYKTRENNFLNS